MNIFIANLHPSTKKEDLELLFSKFGNVISAKVIFDKQTGNSKRYGFVEFNTQDEVDEAVKQLNDTEFQGNKIIVKVSEPKPKN
ncbi:MAG: RNA-binding protein [Bacteroidales bacterium]|jgi:RNA recognition motif-containing protein|nr:RNA-binding protein [Bacteroidales bacterium]MCK9498538.1 RNA-binding protein [Bacteroidales bacterium]MDY0313788.1 RNA-binding protein [Bacteroidales bacterium]NLB86604.1 RNA-binding protein [Bacteroidales bacterium]